MKMKLEHSFYVEPTGLAKGLLLWWTKDTQIKILQYGKHFIDTLISSKGEAKWFGTFIYGPPYKEEKREFWELMMNLRNSLGDRWLVMGDSNIMSSQEEKLGGVPFKPNEARCFFEFIDAVGLIDLPICRGTFMWSNQRSDEEAILEKLDRAYAPLSGICFFLKPWRCWTLP
ncbi:hypothetical protein V6N12_058971 [Hibiscus sabdariffa]|uniref:Uncharacterized protein n=1 Tax=Hibiscus sabdariffa TaxID=183260 RepID=A0ABR2ETR5_9ROSI